MTTQKSSTRKPSGQSPATASSPAVSTVPPLRCEVDRGPNWLFVRIPNELPSSQAGASVVEDWAQEWTERLWEVCEQHFTYRLVVEMHEADPLPEALDRRLRELGDRLTHRGGAIRLCGMSAAGERKLHASDSVLRNHHTRREAVLASDSHESVLKIHHRHI